MTNEKINKGIDGLKEIRMSKVEELNMLENLMSYTNKTTITQAEPIKSNFYNIYFKSLYLNPRFVYSTLSFIGIFFIGSSAIFAAGAVPGDILYPVKTKVVEPVQELLAVTPVAKANLAAMRAEDTLKEADLLIKNNSLNEENRLVLEQDLKRHTDNFNAITQSENVSDSAAISLRKSHLKNTMEQYSRTLNTMRENEHGEQRDQIEKFSNVVNNTFADNHKVEEVSNSTTTENKPVVTEVWEKPKEISTRSNKKRKVNDNKIVTPTTISTYKDTTDTSNEKHDQNNENKVINSTSSINQTTPNVQSTTTIRHFNRDNNSNIGESEHKNNNTYNQASTSTQVMNNSTSTNESINNNSTTTNQQTSTSTSLRTSTSTTSTEHENESNSTSTTKYSDEHHEERR